MYVAHVSSSWRAQARADSLEGLKALLWETAGTGDEQEEREARAELIRTAYPLLTSMEQVGPASAAPTLLTRD